MARAGLGWTLGELAEPAGVKSNTLSRYQSGRDILSGTLRKVEEVLRAAGIIFTDTETGFGVMMTRHKRLSRMFSGDR